MHLFRPAAVLGFGLAIALSAPWMARAGIEPTQTTAGDAERPPSVHRVVVQVSQNDPAVMTMALNNVENLVKAFQAKGEKVEVEIVAYGAGLTMVRADTSPVKDRLAAIAGTMKNVTISGCGNTLGSQSKLEGKPISLVPEARLVSAGIARIVELEEQGWTYIRP